MGEYSMSYGIIRVAKFNSSAVRGIQIHDEREKDRSHSNPDIDFSKTEDNYSLQERANKTYNQVIKERIDSLNLKKAVRKDAVVMSLEQEKAYFQKAYELVKEKYGEQNIISAEIHKDETTPHLHINFIPVTKDNRLSAKSLFDKKSLKQLQDDFYSQVSREFGLDRGGIEEHQKNIDKVTYKREKVKKDLEEINKLEQDIQSKMEHYSKNDVKIERLTADEVKPQKSGFLNMYSETDAGVALRLNKKLENTFKLAEIAKQALNKIKELSKTIEILQKSLKDFKDRFNGLSKEQEQAIFKQIDRFKYENTIKRENQLKSKNMNSQRYLER